MSPKKTQADLVGVALLAHDHWKDVRPNLYGTLLGKGILYDRLFDVGEQVDDYIQGAVNEGMDCHRAKEMALRRWVYLPDIDQESD